MKDKLTKYDIIFGSAIPVLDPPEKTEEIHWTKWMERLINLDEWIAKHKIQHNHANNG